MRAPVSAGGRTARFVAITIIIATLFGQPALWNPAAAAAAPALAAPALTRAIPAGASATVEGRLTAAPQTSYTVDVFSGSTCPPATTAAAGSLTTTTDANGNAFFSGQVGGIATGALVAGRVRAADGTASPLSTCIVAGAGNDTWTRALELTLGGTQGLATASIPQLIDVSGRSRWYRFKVQPGSRVFVTLTNLPAEYELAVFKDIGKAFTALTGPQDLVRLGAEFAPDAYSPDAYSPDAYSPDAYSPDAYSPDAYSPDPAAYSSAQARTLLGVSAFPGTTGQGLAVNTWSNDGYFYVRVRGRNGAFNLSSPFTLTVSQAAGQCASVTPAGLPAASTPVAASGRRTLILADYSRMGLSDADTKALDAKLWQLANRPEVAGQVINLGTDARVQAANAQADANYACPFAKNIVADSIKSIVNAYWASNPLEYIVIVGNDSVIPFYRYPDQSELGSERNYSPPVKDTTSSQAALRLGYVLGQDAYGSKVDVAQQEGALPLANLAVGRLVETPADIAGVIDAYLGTAAGVVPTPTKSLVTGYDFLEDSARAVQAELESGTGKPADTLITPRDTSPSSPESWTADQLKAALLGSRHDLIFLAGHFSANGALAADFSTRVTTDDLAASAVDLTNAIIFSAGCHSGYNIVDPHAVPGVTKEVDWAQGFARKKAALIAGTGYQYGDTDFIYYSERLYLEFSKQLRTGSGPVAIGKALAAAKLAYLSDSAPTRGLFEKSYLEATLFGLPMLSVNMPGARLTPPTEASEIGALQGFAANPGQTLGLQYTDLNVSTPLQWQYRYLKSTALGDHTVLDVRFLSGKDGVVTAPGAPILPLQMVNVDAPGTVLRGVGFRSGTYSDSPSILPLTGGASTEARAARVPFRSDFLFPVQLWKTNYYGELANPSGGMTQLALTPAQLISTPEDSVTGWPDARKAIARQFTNLGLRLYYSSNTATVGANTPAQAAAPVITQVESHVDGANIVITARITGDPSAGVQEAWVTYTGTEAPLHGLWTSADMARDPADSSLWRVTLNVGGDPHNLRFMVQAANGVGLVGLNTNRGGFFTPDLNPGGAAALASQQATALTLTLPTKQVPFGTKYTITASLTRGGAPYANQLVSISVGGQRRTVYTDGAGVASVSMRALVVPGDYDARAAFEPNLDALGASAAGKVTVVKQKTAIALTTPPAPIASGSDSGVAAALGTVDPRPLGQQSVFFIVSGPGGTYSTMGLTDLFGKVQMGKITLPGGTYNVDAYFLGSIPLPGSPANLDDIRYLPATAHGTLTIIGADTTAPTTTATVTGSKPSGCSTSCYTGSVKVTLTAVDNAGGSGVATTQYRIKPAGGSFGPWQTYTAPFTISAEGDNRVEYYSKDVAGNVEATKTLVVSVSNFPSTPVLDTFNRANGALGSNWVGSGYGGYAIKSKQVSVLGGGPVYWKTPFGASQEAYVTMTKVYLGSDKEQMIELKTQGTTPDWSKGAIDINYVTEGGIRGIRIDTFQPSNPGPYSGWRHLGFFPVLFRDGDVLGARATADGKVYVYKNCQFVGMVDTTAPGANGTFFVNKGGRIGLWYDDTAGAILDNFGGGNSGSGGSGS